MFLGRNFFLARTGGAVAPSVIEYLVVAGGGENGFDKTVKIQFII